MIKSEPINLLHVEDSAFDRKAVARALKTTDGDIQVIAVDNRNDALDAMRNAHFDAVLLDIHLHSDNAADLIRSFSALTPVIVITALESVPIAVHAMQEGASEYVVKDTAGDYLKALPLTIRNAVSRKRYELENERLSRALHSAEMTIHALQGLIPICSSCRKVRNDDGFWQQLETFVRENADVEFSHGYCPECMIKALRDIEEH